MKTSAFVILFLLSATFYSSAQTLQEKTETYHLVLQKLNNGNVPIINETFTRIYNYDIDGNYDKWFYHKDKQKSFDTSEIVTSIFREKLATVGIKNCIKIEYSNTAYLICRRHNKSTISRKKDLYPKITSR